MLFMTMLEPFSQASAVPKQSINILQFLLNISTYQNSVSEKIQNTWNYDINKNSSDRFESTYTLDFESFPETPICAEWWVKQYMGFNSIPVGTFHFVPLTRCIYEEIAILVIADMKFDAVSKTWLGVKIENMDVDTE